MNSTSSVSMLIMDSEILTKAWDLAASTRYELLIFVAAVAAHFLLFGNSAPKRAKAQSGKAKPREEDHDDARAHSQPLEALDCQQIEDAFNSAFSRGDHRQVLRCWAAAKRCGAAPSISLARVVESMQRFKKDTATILRELRAFFKRYPSTSNIGLANDLLESLGRRLDSDLAEKVVEMMPSVDMRPDQRTYEILLGMYFMSRSFPQVERLLAEMRSAKVPLTTRATIVIIKTALKTNNFNEAMRHFRELKSFWTAATPSTAPGHIVSQLVELACKEHKLAEFLPELRGVPLSEDGIDTMLAECIAQKDSELVTKVEAVAREQGVKLSDTTYSLLVKGLSGNPARVQALFEEVVAKGIEMSSDLILAFLAFCSQVGSISLANRLFEREKPRQTPVLCAFIRFYAEAEHFERACDIYEQHLQNGDAQRRSVLDSRMERIIMNAALRCGRGRLAKTFLESSPSDVAKHIAMIRSCASEHNLEGVMKVFESLKQSGIDLNSVVYNTVLDACVECRDLGRAEAWMDQMKQDGMTDVVSYNTLIKAHLQSSHFDKARVLMEEMRAAGLQPNRVTFNELVNAMVCKGAKGRGQVWEILEEMRAAGMKPNQVTCSILLKNLNASSGETDILKTMDLISDMDEPMDEVLLSSVVEACVRIGKPDLLTTKLRQLRSTEDLAITGSHTFGSLIKAYGHARDIDGVWRCWKEMRSRHVRPTSITMGCMVEAVVSNGDTEGAYELIHQMQEDEQCRDVLNAVIYCSVLKGFTREKRLERVWAVYEEMQQTSVELSIVTYNTLLDACARCGRMDQVDGIVADMKRVAIKPNVITYSTMLKGYCQAGDIQRGFAILEQMKRETRLKPDEIMYNSLLDGCAQNNLAEQGLSVLKQMQDEGVEPSNFTLSILVKLMNRARKLDTAFSLVEEITAKYNIKPNVHVHTNLIQACVSNRQLGRALSTLERMVSERVQPENRTYTILIRACLSTGSSDKAAGLLRGALGLDGALPCLARCRSVAQCHQLDHGLVNETLVGLAEKGQAPELAVQLLSDIKRHKPRVCIESATQRRVMTPFVAQESSEPRAPSDSAAARPWQSKGRGKGRSWRQ